MVTQGKIRVYKRENKKGFSWTYCIEAGRNPATGKRNRITKSGFKTAKEARAAAQPVLNKLLLGENVIESNITFAEYAQIWLSEYKPSIKKSTFRSAAYIIHLVCKYFGQKPLKDIKLYEFQTFVNNYPSKSVANDMIMYTKMIFKKALKYNIIRFAPVLKTEYPKKVTKIKDVTALYLTKSELQQALLYAKTYTVRHSEFFYYLLFTLAYTGMRLGEACGLIWDDIDFKNKQISIKSTLVATSKNDYFRQSTPKTQSSIRTIFFNDGLARVLKEWHQKQLTLRIQYGMQNKYDVQNFVFTKIFPERDKEFPVIMSCVQQIFRTINSRKIFNKHLHAHLFRHTHVSLLAEAGVSLEVIKERLGHSDDKLTSDIYLHITSAMKENAAKIFEKYMSV